MKITRFRVNPFGENTFVLWHEDTRHCLIVDPGMMIRSEREELADFIENEGLVVQRVVLTHCHIDHVASARWTADRYRVPVCASPLDSQLASQLPQQAARFHLKINIEPLMIDEPLNDSDTLSLDDEQITILSTPGHTPGGIVLYIPSQSIALVGDTIFQGSVGRTDLGGDMATLLHSVQQVILKLPPETMLVPGHGHATTVEQELKFNPYAKV